MNLVRDASLFTVALDQQGNWFRYHHLFRDLLTEQLERTKARDEIAVLHRRASAWFESEEMIDEALDHALAADDDVLAGQIVERHWRERAKLGNWRAAVGWLERLPDGVIARSPELLMATLWQHYDQMDMAVLAGILDQIEPLIDRELEPDRALEVDVFRVFCWGWEQHAVAQTRALSNAMFVLFGNIVLALFHQHPETHTHLRALTDTVREIANAPDRQDERLARAIDRWLSVPAGLHGMREVMRLLGVCQSQLLRSDLPTVATHASQLHTRARALGQEKYVCWADYLGGIVHLRRGELQQAISRLEAAERQKQLVYGATAVDLLAALTLAYELDGQSQVADRMLISLRDYCDHVTPYLPSRADGCAARLAVFRGQSDKAAAWLDGGIEPALGFDTLYLLEVPAFSWCRSLIARHRPGDLEEAQRLLEAHAEVCRLQGYDCQLLEIRTLQALASQEQGQTRDAVDRLTEALDLARPGKVLLPFLCAGPALLKLLAQVEGAGAEYSAHVSAALPQQPVAGGVEPRTLPAHLIPLEPLSRREQDFLVLLAERLQTKEMAERLHVSADTIKYHLKNLYGKLDVSNRRDAALKAAEMLATDPSLSDTG